jgi:multiple sugar transport system substrate-binding protein
MKNFRLFIAAAVAASLLLAACFNTSNSAPPVDKKNAIRMIHWGDIIEMNNNKKIIADIKATKGIDVIQERAPVSSYIEKVLTEAAAGMAPDVMFVEAGNFKAFVDKGLLVNLTELMKNDPNKDFNIKDYYPEIVDRFTVDGKLYVVPRDIAPICVIYYNKKIFDDAGVPYPKDNWTWDDFLKTAQKLTKRDAKGMFTQYGFLDEWTIWEAWVYSNGGAIVDNVKHPTKCVLDTPEAIAGVQFRADLSGKYGVAPAPSVIATESMGVQGTASLFMGGKVAMFYTGYWKSGYFRDVSKFDWDVVMFPVGPKGRRAYPTGGSGYAITSQCKDKQKAWEVLKSFAGEKGQRFLSSQGGLQPAIIKLAESPQFLDDERPKNKKIMLTAVKDIVFTPLIPEWEMMNTRYISPKMDHIWNGKETAEHVLKDLTREINKDFFTPKTKN